MENFMGRPQPMSGGYRSQKGQQFNGGKGSDIPIQPFPGTLNRMPKGKPSGENYASIGKASEGKNIASKSDGTAKGGQQKGKKGKKGSFPPKDSIGGDLYAKMSFLEDP